MSTPKKNITAALESDIDPTQELVKLRKLLAERDTTIQGLQKESKAFIEKMATVESSITNGNKSDAEREASIRETEKQLRTITERNTELEATNQTLTLKIEKFEAEMAALKKAKETAEKTLFQERKKNTQSLNKGLQKKIQEAADARKATKVVEEQLANLKKKFNVFNTIPDLKVDAEMNEAQIISALGPVISRIDNRNLKEALQKKTEELDALTLRFAQLEKERGEIKARYAKFFKELNEKNSAQLQTKVFKSPNKSAYSTPITTPQVTPSNTPLKPTAGKGTSAAAAASDANGKMEEEDIILTGIESTIANFNNTISELKTQNEQFKLIIQRQTKTISKLKETQTKLETENAELVEQHNNSSKDSVSKEDNDATKDEHSKPETGEINDLKTKILRLQNDIETYRKENQTLVEVANQKQTLEESLKEATRKNNELTKQLQLANNAEKQVSELIATIEQQRMSLKEKEKRIKRLNQDHTKQINDEKARTEQLITQKEAELKNTVETALTERLAILQKQMQSTHEKETLALNEQILAQQKQIEGFNSDLELIQTKIKEETTALKKELDEKRERDIKALQTDHAKALANIKIENEKGNQKILEELREKRKILDQIKTEHEKIHAANLAGKQAVENADRKTMKARAYFWKMREYAIKLKQELDELKAKNPILHQFENANHHAHAANGNNHAAYLEPNGMMEKEMAEKELEMVHENPAAASAAEKPKAQKAQKPQSAKVKDKKALPKANGISEAHPPLIFSNSASAAASATPTVSGGGNTKSVSGSIGFFG